MLQSSLFPSLMYCYSRFISNLCTCYKMFETLKVLKALFIPIVLLLVVPVGSASGFKIKTNIEQVLPQLQHFQLQEGMKKR